MVHMSPEVIKRYVAQFAEKVKKEGIVWLDHSGKGKKKLGHRTSMTAEKMVEFAEEYGFEIIAQHFRNEHDCISVLKKSK